MRFAQQSSRFHMVSRLAIVCIANAGAVFAGADAQQPAVTGAVVFNDVTVIDVETGKEQPAQRVVVTGTRITALGSAEAVAVPTGATVVDARGKYLIPGLWDMHVHPQRYVDIAFPLFLANGVTGVRDAGTSVPLATVVQWKREIAAGTRAGPRYLVSGPHVLNGGRDTPQYARTDTTFWFGAHRLNVPPHLARYAVDSLRAAGADFIKTYDMPRSMWFAVAAEARRLGMLFGGHLTEVTGVEASDSGATFLDHEMWAQCERPYTEGDSLKSPRCSDSAQHVAERRIIHNNSWVVVLAILWSVRNQERIDARQRRYLPWSINGNSGPLEGDARLLAGEPNSTAAWRAEDATETDSIFRRGGCEVTYFAGPILRSPVRPFPILVGTDVGINSNGGSVHGYGPPGFSVPRVLECLVLNGLTPLEALQVGTLNPAKALRATDSLGTVAVGKLADLVLLDANPVQDIWNLTKVHAVVANGRYFDRAALDQLLQDAAEWAKHE